MVRITALMLRVRARLQKKQHQRGEVRAGEMRDAVLALVRYSHARHLTRQQRENKSFMKSFPVDEQGVLRIGGRLQMSSLPYDTRHPLVVPEGADIIGPIVRHYHALVGHSGLESTMAEIRTRFWIINARKVINKEYRKCMRCKKMNTQPCQQLMAPLPQYRTRSGGPPFASVGVDYFGPIVVRIGRSGVKRWGAILTCMTTRAVHLEVACDLTASAFINIFQRFISRRGTPDLIVSDNGTNFVGAKNELKRWAELGKDLGVTRYFGDKGIDWRMNTPAASHHGGVWEHHIRTVRQLMIGLADGQQLSDDSLHTLFCSIEQIMNARPLTRLLMDTDSLEPLTPHHLLVLRSGVALPGDFSLKDALRHRWKQTQLLAARFWDRWTQEYLLLLQKRTKWTTVARNLRMGDMVLIMTDSLPRMQWPLGLVEEVIIGSDGLVQSVVVKLQDGRVKRPITK